MTLDDRLSRAANHVADSLIPPDIDINDIRTQARRNTRRTAAMTVAVTVAALVAMGASVVGMTGDRDSTEPIVTPTPTLPTTPTPEETDEGKPGPTTAKEVVFEPAATLDALGVVPGDPEVRMAVWTFRCERCPERESPDEFGNWGKPSYTALALTTDGYETTTYALAPIQAGLPIYVTSPRDDLFLVVDVSNRFQWLVDLDGTVRPLSRVDTQLRPADPRLWFGCHGRWRSTWCSLDPDSATYHVWPKAWDGSAVSPRTGEAPWGAHPQPRAASTTGELEAWWDAPAGRQVRVVAEANGGDYIFDSPVGEMAFWAPVAAGFEIHTSSDGGATWQVETREAPDSSGPLQMRRTAEGALVAFSEYPRFEVWRADASGGPFRKVFGSQSTTQTSGGGLWSQGGILYANAMGAVAVSDDDGRTWTSIETWRGAR